MLGTLQYKVPDFTYVLILNFKWMGIEAQD